MAEKPQKKRKVLGWICTIWGGLIVLTGLPAVLQSNGNAYSMGQATAVLFGAFMLYAGIRELRKPEAPKAGPAPG